MNIYEGLTVPANGRQWKRAKPVDRSKVDPKAIMFTKEEFMQVMDDLDAENPDMEGMFALGLDPKDLLSPME